MCALASRRGRSCCNSRLDHLKRCTHALCTRSCGGACLPARCILPWTSVLASLPVCISPSPPPPTASWSDIFFSSFFSTINPFSHLLASDPVCLGPFPAWLTSLAPPSSHPPPLPQRLLSVVQCVEVDGRIARPVLWAYVTADIRGQVCAFVEAYRELSMCRSLCLGRGS